MFVINEMIVLKDNDSSIFPILLGFKIPKDCTLKIKYPINTKKALTNNSVSAYFFHPIFEVSIPNVLYKKLSTRLNTGSVNVFFIVEI